LNEHQQRPYLTDLQQMWFICLILRSTEADGEDNGVVG
jgi:hypothetical protein